MSTLLNISVSKRRTFYCNQFIILYLTIKDACNFRERIKFPVFSIFQWNSHIHICYCAYGYSTGNFCIQGNLRTIPCSCSVLANIAYTNYSAKPNLEFNFFFSSVVNINLIFNIDSINDPATHHTKFYKIINTVFAIHLF